MDPVVFANALHSGHNAPKPAKLNVKTAASFAVRANNCNLAFDARCTTFVDELADGCELKVQALGVIVALAVFCGAFHNVAARMAFDF